HPLHFTATPPPHHCTLSLHDALPISTSSRNPHAQHHLGAVGLLHLFDTVVTRDDVVNPKPHPEPYLTAAQRLGIEPVHCLALEEDRKSTRLNSSHVKISYAVFCLKKK